MPKTRFGFDFDWIADKRELGYTWKQLGDHYGCEQSSVRQWMRNEAERRSQALPPLSAKFSAGPPPDFLYEDWEHPESVDWREWFKQFKTTLDLHRKIDPAQEILTVNLGWRDEPIGVVFASDLHLGGGYTDHEEITKTMEYILETDGLYLVLAGDVLEGFIPGEKSAETTEQMSGSLKAQLAAMKSLIMELVRRSKLMCMSWGDHDAKWFEKLIGVNVIKQSYHDKVPYFNGRGLVRLLLNDQEYFIQVNHAAPGRSMYSKNAPQKKMDMNFFPADVSVSGHTHKPAFQMEYRLSQLRDVGINLGGKTWYVQCGTYKTGPDGYTIRTWDRGIIGVPTAIFQTHTHDVDIFESPDKAQAFKEGLKR